MIHSASWTRGVQRTARTTSINTSPCRPSTAKTPSCGGPGSSQLSTPSPRWCWISCLRQVSSSSPHCRVPRLYVYTYSHISDHITATSVDTERALSRGGLTVSKRRHALSDESTHAATVLSSWANVADVVPEKEIIAIFKEKSKHSKKEAPSGASAEVITLNC